jgi:hypothetical protein
MGAHSMADGRSLTTISEADYDAIESAVMETERGRWFLREYARRNRNADTQVLLDAIGRLEQAVADDRVAQDLERLRANLKEMASAIAQTKTDIAAVQAVEHEHSRLFEASEALDAITRTTERATSDILAAAEHVQESAWILREAGGDPSLCDELDQRATEIYTAFSFQDLTAQRIAKIVQTLRYLERRIDTMIAVWDRTEAALDPGQASPPYQAHAPETATIDLDQSEIDTMIVGDGFFEQPNPATEDGSSQLAVVPIVAEAPGPATQDRSSHRAIEPDAAEPRLRLEAFAEIDLMPTREKLRAFT